MTEPVYLIPRLCPPSLVILLLENQVLSDVIISSLTLFMSVLKSKLFKIQYTKYSETVINSDQKTTTKNYTDTISADPKLWYVNDVVSFASRLHNVCCLHHLVTLKHTLGKRISCEIYTPTVGERGTSPSRNRS